uniref:Uncharacterized protein n=1 Tax=Oryza brachyantha TaxID=4533 RepID=J3L1A7_ORYBR
MSIASSAAWDDRRSSPDSRGQLVFESAGTSKDNMFLEYALKIMLESESQNYSKRIIVFHVQYV